MKVQTIQLQGQEYVVIPREEYDTLTARSRQRKPSADAGDLAEAARRRAAGKPRSYASLRKSLGLKA